MRTEQQSTRELPSREIKVSWRIVPFWDKTTLEIKQLMIFHLKNENKLVCKRKYELFGRSVEMSGDKILQN